MITIEINENINCEVFRLLKAKQVLAAIYHLCNIANDLAEGKTSDEMLEAAAQEIRRATNALIVAYRLEGDLKSSALKDLKVSGI